MALRWFKSIFMQEPRRFNIYRNYCKAITSEKRLQDNPYYEKYAEKILETQQLSPEEFKQLLNERFKQPQKPTSVMKENDNSVEKRKEHSRFSQQKDLNQILKMEILEDKSAEEIELIWKQYHQSKDGIYAVLPKEAYVDMSTKLQAYPIFLFPLPRAEGYEFIMHQFMENSCYFTSLINYQAYKENAPVSLTITYFTELMDGKGIVLMRGEYDDKALNIQEAQCLANQLQLYYASKDAKKEKLLWTFNKEPESFRHMDLISNFEYELIK